MRENFDEAVDLILGPTIEGGYSNDPRDPGGETNHGISKRAHPNVDIKNLTTEGAAEIYLHEYWIPAHCDDLPWPLDVVVFDSAVNQGVVTAVELLQKTANVAQDGSWGPKTKAAVANGTRLDLAEFVALFMADRALRYTGTRNFDIYGRGWLKRLFKICMDKSVSF